MSELSACEYLTPEGCYILESWNDASDLLHRSQAPGSNPV
jgi:hypothetical protein